jgi:hypothetical protein
VNELSAFLDALDPDGDPELRLAELGRPLSDAARVLRARVATGALR